MYTSCKNYSYIYHYTIRHAHLQLLYAFDSKNARKKGEAFLLHPSFNASFENNIPRYNHPVPYSVDPTGKYRTEIPYCQED